MAAGDIGNNVRTYLAATASVNTLLGTTAEIYSDVLPQRGRYTLPAIVFNVISGSGVRHLTGSANSGRSRIQIDCYANDRPTANAVGEAVRKVMEFYSGAAGDDTIDLAINTTPQYRYEPPLDASEDGLFRHTMDYLLLHSQPAVLT